MSTVLLIICVFVLYVVAYNTYGRYLSRRIFRLDANRPTPACEFDDGIDFVPSHRSLVFGHHFTSIAGTGPIVGPAIAVVWGWVPAMLWVVIGSVFMGAVHDFGSLIISMRHQGRTIADLTGDVINPRVRVLFMIVCVVGLWIVLAIFGLVIATIFKLYPSSVMPVFIQIPIAIGLGIWITRGWNLLLGSVIAVAMMYASIAWSASSDLFAYGVFPASMTSHLSEVGWWTLILMIYVFIASVLPVNVLLQPRDFINSWQLLIAMGLLVLGVLVAQPPIVADALRFTPDPSASGVPAPPMFPFLFITIACGAVSGFHCLVSSGCSSRQLRTEADAQYIGYGAMLTEGFLATLVIIACTAGIGMVANGQDGHAVWLQYYQQWGGDSGLGTKLTPFIEGSANMIGAVGVSHHFAITLMGVFVASFAATTLDSATRLQRYVIAELAGGGRGEPASQCAICDYSLSGVPVGSACPECGSDKAKQCRNPKWRVRSCLTNRYGATLVAVTTALFFALSDAIAVTWQSRGMFPNGSGRWREIGSLWSQDKTLWYELNFQQAGLGGLTLWPIFGATNQLLAALALLVLSVWLRKSGRPSWMVLIPAFFMVTITAMAIVELAFGFWDQMQFTLLVVSVVLLALETWILVEGLRILLNRKKQSDINTKVG